jgi:hypothetical protein
MQERVFSNEVYLSEIRGKEERGVFRVELRSSREISKMRETALATRGKKGKRNHEKFGE